jgi:uncharacterized membrane protein
MSENTTIPAVADVPAAKPRKRKRIFMWFFLAVQLIFIGLIVAYGMESTGPSHADLVAGCYNHAWWPLFKSQADCVQHYGGALNTAGHLGQGIGIAMVIGLWVAADVILGIGRLIVVLARRKG